VEHDPTDIALDDEARALAAKKAELARQTAIGDLKWVMSNKRGRRFVFDRLEQAGVFRLSFSPDPYVTAFNEGKRNDGLRLLAQLHDHAPESYALMLSDHHARSSDN
jgi:hypothetical protein